MVINVLNGVWEIIIQQELENLTKYSFLPELGILTKLRKQYVSISAFGYKTKERYPIYPSKYTCWCLVVKRHVDSLFTGEESERHYALFKDFHTFMYNHKLHHGRKHFFIVKRFLGQ